MAAITRAVKVTHTTAKGTAAKVHPASAITSTPKDWTDDEIDQANTVLCSPQPQSAADAIINDMGLTDQTKEILQEEGFFAAIEEAVANNSTEPINWITRDMFLRITSLKLFEANKLFERLHTVRQRILKARYGSSFLPWDFQNDVEKDISGHSRLNTNGTPNVPFLLLRAHIAALMNVDTVNQTFEMRLNITAILPVATINKQFKRELPQGLKTTTGEELDPTNWEPRLHITNLVETKMWTQSSALSHEYTPKLRHAVSGRALRVKYRIHGTFSEEMELRLFPFDVQNLTVRVASRIPAYSLHFHPMDKFTTRTLTMDITNFNLRNCWTLLEVSNKAYCDSTILSTVCNDYRYPIWFLSLSVSREPGYYIFNIVIPMLLTSTMSLFVYNIPPIEVADRLSVTLTLMLTAVAYKLVVSADIPNVHYLTMLDLYVFMCQAFIFLVSVENTVMGNLAILDHDDHCGAVEQSVFGALKNENFSAPTAFQGCANLDDTWLLALLCGLWVFANLVFSVLMLCIPFGWAAKRQMRALAHLSHANEGSEFDKLPAMFELGMSGRDERSITHSFPWRHRVDLSEYFNDFCSKSDLKRLEKLKTSLERALGSDAVYHNPDAESKMTQVFEERAGTKRRKQEIEELRQKIREMRLELRNTCPNHRRMTSYSPMT